MSVTFETITENYIVDVARYNSEKIKLDNKIKLLTKQVERLEKKKNKLKWPYWTDQLLRPVLDAIKLQLPEYSCDDDRLTPMGIGCRVSVFFTKNDLPEDADKWQDGYSIYIVFIPGSIEKGELFYETGETYNRFQPDTIGAINGFNQVSKLLESIDEAVNFLKSQITHVQ